MKEVQEDSATKKSGGARERMPAGLKIHFNDKARNACFDAAVSGMFVFLAW